MSVSPGRYTFSASLAFLSGVALASFSPLNLLPPLWLLLAISGLCLISVILTNNKYRYWSLLGLFLFLGLWRHQLTLNSTPMLESLGKEIWQGEVQIIQEPRWQKTGIELIVATVADPRVKFLVKTNFSVIYQESQIIHLECQLSASDSQKSYLKTRGVVAACYRGDLTIVHRGESRLITIRQAIAKRIRLGLTEPNAGLASAMLFGVKQDLSPELMTAFSRTGLAHLIAISGMNISLIIWLALITAIAIGFSRRQAFWISAVFIWLFAVLVGAEASVTRAALMGFLVLGTGQFGRLAKPLHILIIAAALMVAYDSNWLIFDLGFQLSFLAILGLGWYYPGILQLCQCFVLRAPASLQGSLNFICQIISATLAAQILTTPLLVWRFGSFSIISLVANILTVWLMPIIMALGLSATALVFIVPSWALLIFLPLNLVLNYLVWINQSLASSPWAIVELNTWWQYLIWLIYPLAYWLKRYFDSHSDKDDKLLLM